MAYRQTNIGLLARINPKLAAEQVRKAFRDTNDDDPGRVVEKAAEKLGVSATTLKRLLKGLADAGHEVEYERKRAG